MLREFYLTLSLIIRSSGLFCTLALVLTLSCKNENSSQEQKIGSVAIDSSKGRDSSEEKIAKSTKKIYLHKDSAFKLVKSKAGKANMFSELADLYLREGDTVLGIQNLEQALKLNPNYIPYLLRLSSIYTQLVNSRCLVLTQRIIKHTKDRRIMAQAWLLRGTYYKERAKIEMQKSRPNLVKQNQQLALTSWDSAIVTDWTLVVAYLEKGALYFANREFQLAKKAFKMAYRINHHHPEIYYWLGRMAELENNITDALENYRNSLVLDKDFQASRKRFDSLKKAQ